MNNYTPKKNESENTQTLTKTKEMGEKEQFKEVLLFKRKSNSFKDCLVFVYISSSCRENENIVTLQGEILTLETTNIC